MQPTDLNAHAAPWQGPRPTSTSSSNSAPSTASPRTSGAFPDDHRSFVLHENVTNAHAAKPDARAPNHTPARSGPRHHLWWGGAQLHHHVPPHVTARGGTHWARRPLTSAPMPAATPATQLAQQHAPVISKETAPRTPLPERIEPKPRVAASATSTPGSLIFDGRMHRNANPAALKAGSTAAPASLPLPQAPSSDRSQSASSTSSSAGRGPLLGSESILFDASVIVQPSVTPAVNVSHTGTSLLSTPPVNAEDLAIILPSPMPTAEDPNQHSRVVFDVADLLGGINLPSQDIA